eukprot:1246514-Amorphochlora_amoeboformis.AAC.1
MEQKCYENFGKKLTAAIQGYSASLGLYVGAASAVAEIFQASVGNQASTVPKLGEFVNYHKQLRDGIAPKFIAILKQVEKEL